MRRTSTPKPAIEPIRDMSSDPLLTPEDCAVVLIDYQPEQVASVRSSPIDGVCPARRGVALPKLTAVALCYNTAFL